MKTTSLALVALVATLSTPALADHSKELDVQRGPTSELYIRKRPPTPEAPVLSSELQELLNKTEKRRDDKRIEAIGELRSFLTSKPIGDVKAEGMFKLAELLWEERVGCFLIRMDEYGHEVEKCTQKKAACDPPKEPKIDLKESETLYKELKTEVPGYKRMDLVTYLIGFAAKEDQREDEAMGNFQEVIAEVPDLAALRRCLDDGRRALVRHRQELGRGEGRLRARSRQRRDERPRDVQERLVLLEARQLDEGCRAVQGGARQAQATQELTGTAEQKRRSHGQLRRRRRSTAISSSCSTEDPVAVGQGSVLVPASRSNGEEYSHDVMIKVAEAARVRRPSTTGRTMRSSSSSTWIPTRSRPRSTSARS